MNILNILNKVAKWTIIRRRILNEYQVRLAIVLNKRFNGSLKLHFQEHQIRVSLLLRRGLQLEDARFVLQRKIPTGFQKPGITTFYGAMEESEQVNWAMAGGPPGRKSSP